MAYLNLQFEYKDLHFPDRPVLDPIARAKAIAEVAGQLMSGFFAAIAAPNAEQTNIDISKFNLIAASIVYKAEDLALPPKVPQSS